MFSSKLCLPNIPLHAVLNLHHAQIKIVKNGYLCSIFALRFPELPRSILQCSGTGQPGAGDRICKLLSVTSAVKLSIGPTRAFSWLKTPTSAFTFKTLLRHYAKQALVSIVSYSIADRLL